MEAPGAHREHRLLFLFVALCMLLVKGVSSPTLNLLWLPVLKDGTKGCPC